MQERHNQFGQPVGAPVSGWTPRALPPRAAMIGRTCRVEPLDPARHGPALADAAASDPDGHWTYLPYERPADRGSYLDWVATIAAPADPMFHAIVDRRDDRAVGVAAFMRIDRGNGTIEVGGINYTSRLQRATAATEAMFLMMRRAFDELGYRRYEWKCDSLNAPSRAAARRLGFRYEGTFRQAVVYKGRNRDTAWFSIVDTEWQGLKAAFERWLDPGNFDSDRRQKRPLSDFMPPE